MAAAPKSIDLSDYFFIDLIFKRDLTGENPDDLLIYKENSLVHTEENFFTAKNPVNIINAKDEDTEEVYEYSIQSRADVQVIRSNDSTSYTGTKYAETVNSSSEDEVFDLKTGYDTIKLSGNIGNDVVTTNKGETLTLDIGYYTYVKNEVSGDDVILKYYAHVENIYTKVTTSYTDAVHPTFYRVVTEQHEITYKKTGVTVSSVQETTGTYIGKYKKTIQNYIFDFETNSWKTNGDAIQDYQLEAGDNQETFYNYQAIHPAGEYVDEYNSNPSGKLISDEEIIAGRYDTAYTRFNWNGAAYTLHESTFKIDSIKREGSDDYYMDMQIDETDNDVFHKKGEDFSVDKNGNFHFVTINKSEFDEDEFIESETTYEFLEEQAVTPETTTSYYQTQTKEGKIVFENLKLSGVTSDDLFGEGKTFDIYGESIYLGQVTIKDYASEKIQTGKVKINDFSLEAYNFDPKVVGNEVTGTKLDEYYQSTVNDEDITLKTGSNAVEYSITQDANGNLVGWGNDKLFLTKGEYLDLYMDKEYCFKDNETLYTYKIEHNTKAVGKDLVITSVAVFDNNGELPAKYKKEYELGSIKIINIMTGKTGANVYINNGDLFEAPTLTYGKDDVTSKGVLTGSILSDNIDLENYISENGTGVKINTKGGNDVIKGSFYNDTINSGSDDNEISENFGNNTITAGNGDNRVFLSNTSSNTVKLGNGSNFVVLSSVGVNNITCTNGLNYIYTYDGNNKIKTGNGGSLIVLHGGVNNVITGSGRDTIDVETVDPDSYEYDPNASISKFCNNIIKTGSGSDEINVLTDSYNIIDAGDGGKNYYNEIIGNRITLKAGINEVKSGKHADKITITGGQNTINSGAGNDIITVSGGKSIINGAAGNDIYNVNINTFNSDLLITDVSGTNTLNLGKDNTASVNIFFDVTLNNRGKAVFSEMKFTTTSVVGKAGFDNLDGINVSNKKVISKLEYGDNTLAESTFKSFEIKSSEVDKLAADIASWLNTKELYNSTDDVFASDNGADINTLVSAYTNFANNGYVFNESLLS